MNTPASRAFKKFRIVFLFSALFFLYSPVSAQESVSVRIQPTLFEEKIDPGKSFSSAVRVTNMGSSAEVYAVLVQDIEAIDDEGHPIFAKEHEPTGFELGSWVTVSRSELAVSPGQTADVPFTVAIPENASPGGHFGAIFLSTKGDKPDTVGASVGYQVGTILSFQVSGDVIEEARIRQFTSDKTIYGEPKAVFHVKVENLGNTLVRPRGLLEIVDMFGKKAATLNLNDKEAAILPHSIREFSVAWDDDRVRMGKYQAIASLEYGTDVKHTIFSELSFWIIPLKVALPILGVIVLLALIAYLSAKLYIRKKMREYGIPKGGRSAAPKEISSKGAWFTIAFIGFLIIFLLGLFAIFA